MSSVSTKGGVDQSHEPTDGRGWVGRGAHGGQGRWASVALPCMAAGTWRRCPLPPRHLRSSRKRTVHSEDRAASGPRRASDRQAGRPEQRPEKRRYTRRPHALICRDPRADRPASFHRQRPQPQNRVSQEEPPAGTVLVSPRDPSPASPQDPSGAIPGEGTTTRTIAPSPPAVGFLPYFSPSRWATPG